MRKQAPRTTAFILTSRSMGTRDGMEIAMKVYSHKKAMKILTCDPKVVSICEVLFSESRPFLANLSNFLGSILREDLVMKCQRLISPSFDW